MVVGGISAVLLLQFLLSLPGEPAMGIARAISPSCYCNCTRLGIGSGGEVGQGV